MVSQSRDLNRNTALEDWVVRNLDLKAKDETEMDLLSKFMEAAKDDGWMMKYSAKAEGDVFKHFRKQRNYLKSQVNHQFKECAFRNVCRFV